MTTTATFTRRNKSIDIPLSADSAGAPTIARDVGKPNQSFQTNGRNNPRSADFWSALENYTLFGYFTGSSAYSDAITLSNLIKSGSGDNATLNIPLSAYPSTINCQPAAEQEQALQLVYPPGMKDRVEVQLSLTRVSETKGIGVSASTPTASGTGPIQLDDGTNTVTLETDTEVTRTVGRPNSPVRRSTKQHPRYIEKRKSAYDAFEIAFEKNGNASTITDLVGMFNTQLDRGTLTLDFQGQYGLGSFDVVPEGSNALRQVAPAGSPGQDLIPSINLRVVDNA